MIMVGIQEVIIESVSRVQILDKVVFISLHVNIMGENLSSCVLPLARDNRTNWTLKS